MVMICEEEDEMLNLREMRNGGFRLLLFRSACLVQRMMFHVDDDYFSR